MIFSLLEFLPKMHVIRRSLMSAPWPCRRSPAQLEIFRRGISTSFCALSPAASDGTDEFFRQKKKPASLISTKESSDQFSGSGTSLEKFQIAGTAGPGNAIQRVHDRGFVVNRIWFQGGLILSSVEGDGCWLWDCWDFREQLAGGDLRPWQWLSLLHPRPEVLLVGTGAQMHPLPAPLLQFCRKLGVQVESMNSKRAAATYNILVDEGRRVVAAMLPTQPVRARSPLVLPTKLE